ncbi:MAG TPA: ATP-binding protein, partial [Candidatus Eisenbacteria bacterium]
ATRRGDVARVSVEDSGRGIPAGEHELVFDRFSQASNSYTGSGGTGLGLPLSREIVEAHGGRIWAEDGAPKGTRLIFEIPFAGRGEPHAATDFRGSESGTGRAAA